MRNHAVLRNNTNRVGHVARAQRMGVKYESGCGEIRRTDSCPTGKIDPLPTKGRDGSCRYRILPATLLEITMKPEGIMLKDEEYREGYSDGFRKAWDYQEQYIRILQQQLNNVKVNDSHNCVDAKMQKENFN